MIRLELQCGHYIVDDETLVGLRMPDVSRGGKFHCPLCRNNQVVVRVTHQVVVRATHQTGVATSVYDAPHMTILPGYESIGHVLQEALDRAQKGKGKDRHDQGRGLAFEVQPICAIPLAQGTTAGLDYQVLKKQDELGALDPARRRMEILDQIVYLAAKIIVEDEFNVRKDKTKK